MNQKIRIFIPLAVAITGVTFIILGTTQQLLRLGANDPQLQISRDYATNMTSHAFTNASLFQGPEKIDIATNLAPFMIFYDSSGKVIVSTGQLNGKNPVLPKGIFNNAKENNGETLTWQPEPGIRIATVITPYSSSNSAGFVLAGRNMKEVEANIHNLEGKIMFGWLVTIIGTFIATLLFVPSKKK
ncbi:MAG TPA: hypothetical protein VHE53_00625 [Patescibacteria group bacterium]|nr:hypothetical protein [Patescibacteria group bacterium]